MNDDSVAPRKKGFYPASYLIMVATALLMLGALSGLGAILIDYWMDGVSALINDMVMFYLLASLLVVVPLHIFAYSQVRKTNKQDVSTFSLRWSNGLLGLFLLIVVGSCISMGTWLLAMWFNAFLGTGEVTKHLVAVSLGLLQAIAWSVYATYHFVRLRTDESRPKYYVIAISSLSALIFIISFAFPAMAYRDVARDFVKERDLDRINRSVASYVDEQSTLPKSLNDLSGLDKDAKKHLSDYEYVQKGGTKFGIFAYELCTDFARSNGEGKDTGFGFASHAAGKQCFTRTTISFEKLNQDLTQDAKNVSNGIVKLQHGIQNFLLGAESTVNQEVTGIEAFAGGQVKQLEATMEGLEGGTTTLQKEMQRLESNLTGLGGNLTGLEGDTGQLAQDFAAVEKFLHDLGCLFGGCSPSQN